MFSMLKMVVFSLLFLVNSCRGGGSETIGEPVDTGESSRDPVEEVSSEDSVELDLEYTADDISEEIEEALDLPPEMVMDMDVDMDMDMDVEAGEEIDIIRDFAVEEMDRSCSLDKRCPVGWICDKNILTCVEETCATIGRLLGEASSEIRSCTPGVDYCGGIAAAPDCCGPPCPPLHTCELNMTFSVRSGADISWYNYYRDRDMYHCGNEGSCLCDAYCDCAVTGPCLETGRCPRND